MKGLGNYIPNTDVKNEKEPVLYQVETPRGVSRHYDVRNLRISQGGNLVMDTGETGMIILHGEDELAAIPHGIRGANALDRLARKTPGMHSENLDGSPLKTSDLCISANVELKHGKNAPLTLRISHHETKGRAFNFVWNHTGPFDA